MTNEQTSWIISIVSPIVACVVFYMKSSIKNSNNVTSTLLDAYIKNLDKNSEMVSRLTLILEKSVKSLDKIEDDQCEIKRSQNSILEFQHKILSKGDDILNKL